MSQRFGDVTLAIGEDHVAEVKIHRPPANYFDVALIRSLADAYASVDADRAARAIVLSSEGKHFCAGADFTAASSATPLEADQAADLYEGAVRLFAAATPVVASVQGAAIGGGLGLACSADFRVACPEARFAANFARLGFHQGFGLSVTLPAIVGQQAAMDMLYTGRRVGGAEAAHLGLADRLVPQEQLAAVARAFAGEIASSAPLAVVSIRHTLRGHLADEVREVTRREEAEQARLRQSDDFAEGIRATAERRAPYFTGR
ncbi:MAG: enoyl-CoA hydratase/isomerase family protein [Acidimicrobiales bacterium]